VHTLFNVTAIAIIYPVRVIRDLPVRAAELLAKLAVYQRKWALAYVVTLFILIPLIGILVLS
jgi:sodium-dependent phosphate cotransporter